MVDVGVDVDQPRRHDGPAYVLDLACLTSQAFAHGGDLAALDGDVENRVHAVALVEDAAALQDEIVALRGCRHSSIFSGCLGAGGTGRPTRAA